MNGPERGSDGATAPEDVLDFWLGEVGLEGWYAQDDALDARAWPSALGRR